MNKTPKSKWKTLQKLPSGGRVSVLIGSNNMTTDIITRMEAMQQRFGRLQLCDSETHVHKFDREIGLDQSSADNWKKRWEAELKDRYRPESERQILRCAPPFDAQAEHEKDLEYESRVDCESWQYDGPEEKEDV